jgi:hypothetical protein
MSRESQLVIVLVSAVCMLLGVVVGIAIGDGVTPVPTAAATRLVVSPSTPTPIASGMQVAILVLGVDSTASPRPRLEGCWVITFQTGLPQYYLLGFSPATLVPDATNAHTLEEVYDTDLDIGGRAMFTRDALKSISPGLAPPQYEVVFDRQMLAWAVNTLNGISLDGEWINGDTLLARYDAIPPDNPVDRLAFQGAVLEAILKTAQRKDWSSNSWEAFLKLGQHWQPNAQAFVNLVELTLPTASEAEFYIKLAPLTPGETPSP